jgi:hypothetical protein
MALACPIPDPAPVTIAILFSTRGDEFIGKE